MFCFQEVYKETSGMKWVKILLLTIACHFKKDHKTQKRPQVQSKSEVGF